MYSDLDCLWEEKALLVQPIPHPKGKNVNQIRQKCKSNPAKTNILIRFEQGFHFRHFRQKCESDPAKTSILIRFEQGLHLYIFLFHPKGKGGVSYDHMIRIEWEKGNTFHTNNVIWNALSILHLLLRIYEE